MATTNIAQAGMRNWAYDLHNALGEHGVYVANAAINLMIADSTPADVPFRGAAAIAEYYRAMYVGRTLAEHVIETWTPPLSAAHV